ncbi:MAG: PqqD family protein [Oscillospiraceae bacterium]|jgi:hypothetical protein|nr:PqqD family protein [Oscillospiraceae bacterium]
MKLKEGFIIREIMDEFLVVPTGERVADFNALISLNKTGAVLWQALAEEKQEAELAKILLNEFEVDEATAAKDTAAFLEILRENELVVENE